MDEPDILHWLTGGEVARRAGISPERVRQLADRGRIPYVRSRFGRLFSPQAVDAFLQSRRVPSVGSDSDCVSPQLKPGRG
jgi:excisionase family DNA binding protein